MQPTRFLAWKAAAGFVLLCLLWLLLAAFAVYRTHATQVEAEHFVEDLRQLQVGHSTADQITRLANRYRGQWRKNPTSENVPPCGSGARIVDFVFENRWLHWFLFAPFTRFSATIYVKDNRACFRSMGMFNSVGGFTGVHVTEFRESPISRSFDSQLNLVKAVITMDAGATSQGRAAAFSVNLDCLSQLRGCRDTRQMAPLIWQNSRQDGPTLWHSQWDE